MKQNIEFHLNFFSLAKREKWHAKPKRDWQIVFWSVSAFALFLTCFHLFLFVYLLSHETFSETENAISDPKKTLNQKLLQGVVSDFQQKSEVTKKLLIEPPVIADPGR